MAPLAKNALFEKLAAFRAHDLPTALRERLLIEYLNDLFETRVNDG